MRFPKRHWTAAETGDARRPHEAGVDRRRADLASWQSSRLRCLKTLPDEEPARAGAVCRTGFRRSAVEAG